MSEDPENPAPETTHFAPAPRAEVADLQAQLRRAAAETDRHVAEKAEVLRLADAVARERDDLRQRLAAIAGERDKLHAESSSIKSALADATSRAEAAAQEIVKLGHELASHRSADSLEILWSLIVKETKRGLAFVRGKIPEGHPALKWFDLSVETVTQVGCFAVQASVAFVKWATPVAKDLFAKLMSEAQTRLAKK